MAADTGPGIERLKAERLGGCRLDYVPDVDAHPHAQQFQLIHQRDVHAPVDVFEQLGHFRHGGSRNRHGAAKNRSIKLSTQLRSRWIETAHNFRDVGACYGIIARSSRSGENATKNVYSPFLWSRAAFSSRGFFSRIGTSSSSVVPDTLCFPE